jgi:hypothetical protein
MTLRAQGTRIALQKSPFCPAKRALLRCERIGFAIGADEEERRNLFCRYVEILYICRQNDEATV